MKNKILTLSIMLVMAFGMASAGTESISRIDYTSNGEFFDGELITIDYISDRSTEDINVLLDSNSLSSQTGKEVRSDLTISVDEQSSYVEYSISDSSRIPVYEFDPYVTDWYFDRDNALQEAKNNCYDTPEGDDYYEDKRWTQEHRFACITVVDTVGTPGDITKDREVFETTWAVESDGGTERATISNTDVGMGQSTRIGSNTQIEWNGNLDTGNIAPDSSDELGLHSNSFGWKVVKKQAYNEYLSYLNNDLGDDLQAWTLNSKDRNTFDDQLDSRTQSVNTEFFDSPLASADVTDSSLSSGQLQYDPEEDFVFPSFTLFVDAGENGFVEIGRPVGTPEIIGSSGDRFGESEEGQVSMTVRNRGDGSDTFEGRVTSCSTGFSPDDVSKRMELDPGQYYTFNFDVSFTSTGGSGEVNGDCSMEATAQGSQETVSTSVDVTGVQNVECTGEFTVETDSNGDDVIYSCDGGQVGGVVERCDGPSTGDEEARRQSDGSIQCQQLDSPQGGDGLFSGLIPDFELIPSFGGFNLVQWFDIVVASLAGMAGFSRIPENFPVRDFLDRVIGFTGRAQVVNLVASLVIGVFMFVFVYEFISSPLVKALIFAGLVLYAYIYTALIDPVVDFVQGVV